MTGPTYVRTDRPAIIIAVLTVTVPLLRSRGSKFPIRFIVGSVVAPEFSGGKYISSFWFLFVLAIYICLGLFSEIHGSTKQLFHSKLPYPNKIYQNYRRTSHRIPNTAALTTQLSHPFHQPVRGEMNGPEGRRQAEDEVSKTGGKGVRYEKGVSEG